MKKIIVVAVVLLFLFAQTVKASQPKSAKLTELITPPVPIGDLHFHEDEDGGYIAFSNGNPSVFDKFEHPVLCSQFGGFLYEKGDIPVCMSPSVFMEKGGRVKFWRELWENDDIYNQEREARTLAGQVVEYPDYLAYYVTETPKYVYYCVYPFDAEASLCRLFPDDPNIKVGDQFASCSSSFKSWARDKDGVLYDCDKDGDFRWIKFMVVSVSEKRIFLRGIVREVSPALSLDENGRMDMMGMVNAGDNVSIMVKLKGGQKAAKNSTTQKK